MNNFRNIFSRILRPNCRRFSQQAAVSNLFSHRWRSKGIITISILSGCGVSWYMSGNKQMLHAKDAIETVIEEADHLYSTGDEPRHLYEYLRKYKDFNNAELLWRVARAARDLALKGNDVSADEKKALIYEALEISKQALEVYEMNWGSHKWFAITLGDVGDYEGIKIKISNAYIIKDHLERALKLNPKDATTAHCIGQWCFVFAELPWYQQKISSLLFATPPTSTYEEALKMFELAEKTEPNFYSMNHLYLGRCYMNIGDVKRAMMYFDKTITYPATNDEDADAIEEAKKLLDELIAKNKK